MTTSKDTNTATIVIADDQYLIRRGLRSLLQTEEGFEILAETEDGLDTVEVVEHMQPTLLICDLKMPGLNGIEITKQLNKRAPQTRVIILSIYNDESYVIEALQSGASAFVLKESAPDELLHAIRETVVGHRYLCSALSQRAIELYVDKKKDKYEKQHTGNGLTNREQEILHLSAEGNSAKRIAERLCISRRTVESHRANVLRKLGLKNQSELIRYAIRAGILPEEE